MVESTNIKSRLGDLLNTIRMQHSALNSLKNIINTLGDLITNENITNTDRGLIKLIINNLDIARDYINNNAYLSDLTFNFTIKDSKPISNPTEDELNLMQVNLVKISNLINEITIKTDSTIKAYFELKKITENKTINKEIFAFRELLLNLQSSTEILNSFLNKISESIKIINFEINNTLFKYENVIFDKYIKEIKEKTDITLKRIETESAKLLDNHEHKVKLLEDDFNKTNNDFKLLEDSFKNIQKNNEDLQHKILQYNNTISKILSENKKDIEDKLEQNFVEIELYSEKRIQKIEDDLNNTIDTHKDFINLVENAGIYNLTENYSRKADEEKIEYKKFRSFTGFSIIAAIICTIFILMIPIVEYWGSNPPVATNYFTILARLSISLMFFVLAFYFSKQASKHYECYQENNRTFLQLAALEPFISRMSDQDKLEIRKSLIPSYFNQTTEGKFSAQGNEVDLPANMYALVSKALDMVNSKQNKTTEEKTSESKSV